MTWRADYAKEAYADGKQAFRDGVDANPHPMGCFEFGAWSLGYETAQGMDYQIALVRALHPPVRRRCQIDRVLEGVS